MPIDIENPWDDTPIDIDFYDTGREQDTNYNGERYSIEPGGHLPFEPSGAYGTFTFSNGVSVQLPANWGCYEPP